MARLSYVQIAQVARKAGFTGNSLIMATAIGMAESSGSTTVINRIGCVGIWQIYRKMHQPTYRHWTVRWLQNPYNNAKAAWILSKHGKNWRPWEVYTKGMYRKHLPAARRAVATVGKIGTGGGISIPSTSKPTTQTKIIYTGVSAAKVLKIAASQIGYAERRGNRTKYWTDLKINQGQPWCGGFTTWCLWKAGYSLSKIKSMVGGNPYHVFSMRAYAKRHGRWKSSPRPGDLVVFSYSHVGLVEKVFGKHNIQTIEGNTSGGSRGSQNNGGMVARRRRTSSISGYIRIDYNGSYQTISTGVGTTGSLGEGPPPDIDQSGILTVNGQFNSATAIKLARYYGTIASGTPSVYWKAIEVAAGFPIKYHNGKLDYETVCFVQWCMEATINGVWNAATIKSMQNYLNKWTNKEKPDYQTMMAGAPK